MFKTISCSQCGTDVHKVDIKVTSVVCWECLASVTEEPVVKKKQRSGFPRGWKFKKVYVHLDGTVFFKGVEQPDLKGQYEPTPQEAKPKKTKQQKQEEKANALVLYNKLKKELKNETRKTYKKKIETKLKKLQKQIQ